MCKKKTKKPNKCAVKCVTCQFYDKDSDFCTEKGIEDCTKQISTDFAQCGDFLVKESLIMF
jgi:hypothetical protein